MSDPRPKLTITTGDYSGPGCCQMHAAAVCTGIAPWYRILTLETSVIARGLSMEVLPQ
jgi:hypothetical protein